MRNRGRTRLRFQPPIAGNDGFGSNPSAGGWGVGIEIGVNLVPASGAERESNGVVTSTQTYRIEVRSHYFNGPSGINPNWRVYDELGGRVFNIVSVAQKDLDLRWTNVVITIGEPP